jgi:hypothetical protein
MDMRLAVVVGLTIGCGAIGGWAAYLTAERPAKDESRRTLTRFVVLGIIAAASVPLFLSLVRSQVTQAMFTAVTNADKDTPGFYESYLIFAGICLIAGFSARRFIDSISKQVLQRLDEVQEKASQAAASAADAKQVVHEVAAETEAADDKDAPAPPEIEGESNHASFAATGPISVTADERRALQAMVRRTYRTRTGIAEDSGISRNRISEILDALHQKKLALPTKSPNTGGSRWTITHRGNQVLESDPG